MDHSGERSLAQPLQVPSVVDRQSRQLSHSQSRRVSRCQGRRVSRWQGRILSRNQGHSVSRSQGRRVSRSQGRKGSQRSQGSKPQPSQVWGPGRRIRRIEMPPPPTASTHRSPSSTRVQQEKRQGSRSRSRRSRSNTRSHQRSEDPRHRRGFHSPRKAMEKPARYKAKNKKPAPKPKTSKKRKSEGNEGPTCSMFLAELTRKLASKRKQEEEEEPRNIIHMIIESITNALPIKLSKKISPQKCPSPMKIETLRTFAPELTAPSDTLVYSRDNYNGEPAKSDDVYMQEVEIPSEKGGSFKMPKMPLVSSEVLKTAIAKKKKITMQDQGVNTGMELDVAAEISKHVNTLRKISLIAEEFNQKTAKNLKEIVDSVQEDLIKKLAEIQAEQSIGSERAFILPEEKEE